MRVMTNLLRIGLLLACAMPLAPDSMQVVTNAPVPALAHSDELVVLIRNGATSFYVDAEGKYAGVEYDLVMLFAQQMGKKVKFVVAPRMTEMAAQLARGEAHLAAGMLHSVASNVQEGGSRVVLGPIYHRLQPVLAYRAEQAAPKDLAALRGNVVHVEGLFGHTKPALESATDAPLWRVADAIDSEELIERVASGVVDYAVVESRGASAAQNVYPHVATAFPVGNAEPVSWAWSGRVSPDFADKVQAFFQRTQKDGTLARLIDRYFGHLRRLQAVDASEFLARRVSVLPRFRRHFLEAEERYGVDWRLLAALAYQESHWEPLATSPYGVRGLMMLTADTADRLGVRDRLDPRESALGGAKYVANLKAMIPATIAEPDRTWMALAAYNIGIAHLSDARTLARRLKKNPDSWADLKSVIPLLRNAEYFSTLKFGFARGGETVIFVENLRSYFDILCRFEPAYKNVFPPFLEQVTVTNPDKVRLGIDASKNQREPP